MVDIPDSPDSKIWLTIADEDFGFASVGLVDKQTHYFPQICFHYQQATEKYLITREMAEQAKESTQKIGNFVKERIGRLK